MKSNEQWPVGRHERQISGSKIEEFTRFLPAGWPQDVPLVRLTTCGCAPLQIEVLHGFEQPEWYYGPVYAPPDEQTWHANATKTALALLAYLASQPHCYAAQDTLAQALRPGRQTSPEEAQEENEDGALKRPENVVTQLRRVLYPPALLSLPEGDQRALRNLLIRRVMASQESGPGYILAPLPLLWLDVEVMEAQATHAFTLEQFGESAMSAWQNVSLLGSQGIFLPHEPYSDWAAWRRSRVRELLWQSVDAQLQTFKQWDDQEAADEASLRVLFQFWHGHKGNEDAFRLLAELLGRRERFEQAEECYLALCAALEREGCVPHERTEAVMAFVRTKQIQRKPLWVRTEDQDVDRRQAMKVIGIAGVSAALATPEIDQEINHMMARKLTRLHHWVIDMLEEGTRLRWQLYSTSSNSLMEDGLVSQIEHLEQLADEGGDHSQRICRVLAQNYQLAGSISRDRFEYRKAFSYFQKAEQLHAETHLADLTAASIARRGVALLRKDPTKYLREALALYRRAVDFAKHAEPYTQAYVLSRYAEALARTGSYDECIQSLDQAEELLNRVAHVPIEEDVAYVRFTLQSLADSRGECYVLLGKPEKGLEQLQAAQTRLKQPMSRNNCCLLMQQAEAYLAASQPDACVQHALQGLDIARTLESTSNIYWAREILAKLHSSAFRSESVVADLAEAIRG